ncbi:unnamed protein product [Rotaria magnacalcarata]|uniref:Uncharacterized protein n=1 Tax=Rotaria magnacalcarata TaxID=392030 RepID=A0A819LGC2_9BILA|nr:unnamed protein product [Rotaria magnacalcarata]CAF1521698.1 unnamed protein product [Rotaria magnacalcarata]CAF2112038.1 unnamed protein product [Rotaria magnacalcarata]CAF2224708.1 unnamed protein product [Rotaria magnacalcarata]CAF3960909.1 unnamed protein product [Rotaria magnacalcarata]
MGKKTKDAVDSPKKEVKVKKVKEVKVKQPKVKAPVDPVKTNNLIRLLNILALLLAIGAFLLQLAAVLSHHWKWQRVALGSIMSQNHHAHTSVHEDSSLYQNFGLFSRDVKLFANNDEQLEVEGSTRFPRVDDTEEAIHQCLSQTPTLRGVFLACSEQVSSPKECHCRRHPYWNAVIFFEIAALIFLGIVVFLTALLTTHLHALLKLAAAGLALLAFLFLFIGLLLILSYRKRETRSLADAYPHIYHRLASLFHLPHDTRRAVKGNPSVLHEAIRRQAQEFYRAYPLRPGQYPYNETHFTEYSEQARAWIHVSYSNVVPNIPAKPLTIRDPNTHEVAPTVTATIAAATDGATDGAAPLYNAYGPLAGYNEVFDHTDAGIGWSTVLSIFALILALLLPLLLILSWLKHKSLSPDSSKVVTTSVKTEYTVVPQEIPSDSPEARLIPADYDPQRPIGDAIVKTQNIGQGRYNNPAESIIVHDVIISGDQPVPQVVQQHEFPVTIGTNQSAYRT